VARVAQRARKQVMGIAARMLSSGRSETSLWLVPPFWIT